MTATDNQVTRSKLIQIFRYLQALNQLRNPVQREVDDQEWVLWLHDLPDHPCIRRSTFNEAPDDSSEDDGVNSDDFILKVKRPTVTEPPDPPKDLLPWLQPGWQNVDGKVLVQPTLNAGIDNRVRNFSDEPRLKTQLEEWNIRREAWVTTERPARAALTIFENLYALYSRLERESERLELMIGDGVLEWQPIPALTIHHPVLLLRLQLRFDPEIPEFTLLESSQTSELYTAIFQTIPDIKATEIAHCREDLEQGNWHPLGGNNTELFLKRLINRISSQGAFLPQGTRPKNKTTPSISRDPVLFIRPRTLGISTALEAILEILPDSNALPDLPYSLTSLTGLATPPNVVQSLQVPYSPNGEDEYILLSKPANAEQLEIARRLDRNGAVLVQGPPGTGKTHTIANLIGYLLSQGKRVLVTSEKPKALRVLREKVVEPLQPLCVSILEDDNRKQMESTIDAISERLATTDANRLDREAAALTQQRLTILLQLRETRQKLAEARGSEYRAIVMQGQSYAPAEAARYVQQQQEMANWIPGPVAEGAALPLSISELLDLYNSNAVLTPKDERQIVLLLPESRILPSPLEFEQCVNQQTALVKDDFGYRRNLWFVDTGGRSPERIVQLQQRLVQEIEPLRELNGWRLAAIAAGRDGGAWKQAWDDLLQEIEQLYTFAAQAQLKVLKYNPVIPPDCLNGHIEKVLDELIDFLKKGGKIHGFKMLTKREWKPMLESTSVNGTSPETVEHFEALRDFVHLQAARGNLVNRWQRQVTTLGGFDTRSLGIAPEKALHEYVAPLRQCLHWFSNTWAPLENEIKRQGLQWDAFLTEVPIINAEHGDILRLRLAVVEKLPPIIMAEMHRRQHALNEERLRNVEQALEKVSGIDTKAEVVYRLLTAIKQRDIQSYRAAYEGLTDLHAKRNMARQRKELLAKLESSAPGWAKAIRERIGIHGERNLPGDAEIAWQWRQLSDELDRRARTSLEVLQDKITGLNNELFRITAELVEKRAWAEQVRHTTLEQQRALQGWRILMKKVGKGTGKRAPHLLKEARDLMPICQTAVPVWIMPLSLVARNFDMKLNRFDVVIIDEASQADITALIAVFMGKQVVVVGDHEQVSPMAVGQNLDNVQHLIEEHLKGIRLAAMYDGKLSIYDLAKTTFQLVCLLEHFRCVSPIIQFSNDLSYDGKIKPLRDDSEVRRRPATVAYPVKSFDKSGKSSKVNEEEAVTIASLLIAASEQTEYKDATFGVISMLGTEQAYRVDTLLHEHMSTTEYVQRRVLCGDAAQFQGDERDVMFLSLVDVPAENGGPLSMRAEEGHDNMFKKRFNVAASRARDQMWVVYSLDPTIDLKPGDLRRRLILHARDHQANNDARQQEIQKIESEFEEQVFDRLVNAGYKVTTQWPVGTYRIDMVVEGHNKRLAVECDGDRWHPQEKLAEDMARQAILERLGWRFVRIRGSQFFRNPEQAMEPVFAKLRSLGIPPEGMTANPHAEKDGKELKERIIRRATILREEWKNTGNAVTSVKSQPVRMESAATVQRSTSSAYSSSALVPPTNKFAGSTNVVQGTTGANGVTQRSQLPATNGKTEPSAIRSNAQSEMRETTSDTFNKIAPTPEGLQSLIIYLSIQDLKIIDKRSSNGTIWVLGGIEHSTILQKLKSKGIYFVFSQRGGEATNYKAAWYLQRKK